MKNINKPLINIKSEILIEILKSHVISLQRNVYVNDGAELRDPTTWDEGT